MCESGNTYLDHYKILLSVYDLILQSIEVQLYSAVVISFIVMCNYTLYWGVALWAGVVGWRWGLALGMTPNASIPH